MADIDLVVFDDAVARDWYPFTLTRPAGELLLGTLTLRQRLEAVSGARCIGHLTSGELAGFDEEDAPRVLDFTQIDTGRPRLFLSSRCVLHWDVDIDATAEATYRVADQVAGWFLPAGAQIGEDDILTPSAVRGAAFTLGGNIIENAWELIQDNADHVASDILHSHPSNEPPMRLPHAHVIGDYPIILGENVKIEPAVVFDVTAGPVWLDDDVHVNALTRIAGPMYVGEASTLLGGTFNACSIGPHCKVHGELGESIILGYSNKAHDGFIGHSYLGKWVNLGAMTTNSNLKNNYSNVRVHTPAGEVDTGMNKLGSLIGDHVKTAIGTLLNTGTVVGTGSNIFGGMPPKHVRPFSWGAGRYKLEEFLETTRRAMARRNVELSDKQKELLTRAWQLAQDTDAS